MKRLLIFVFVVVATASALGAQAGQQRLQLQPPNGGNGSSGERARPAPATAVRPAATAQQTNEQLLLALYMSEFQRQVGINDEQAARFRPIVTQWLNQRRNMVARRNEALNILKQMVASGAPETEISRQILDVDQLENQTRNSERRLLNNVDPMLTPLQQAKFRLFQVDMEKRIRELLDAATTPTPPRGANAQPRPNAVQTAPQRGSQPQPQRAQPIQPKKDR